MKINKVLIRTLHFFGLCNDQQHIDDVSVRILDNSVFKKKLKYIWRYLSWLGTWCLFVYWESYHDSMKAR
jgi:hypothetical protein